MWHWVLFKIATKTHHQKRWIVNFIHHAKNKLKVCAMLRIVKIAKYYYDLLRLRYNLRDIWVWSVETWRQMLMTCLDLSQQALRHGYLSHQHEMLPTLPQTQQFIIKPLLIDLFSIYILVSKTSCFSDYSLIFHMQMNTTLTITWVSASHHIPSYPQPLHCGNLGRHLPQHL